MKKENYLSNRKVKVRKEGDIVKESLKMAGIINERAVIEVVEQKEKINTRSATWNPRYDNQRRYKKEWERIFVWLEQSSDGTHEGYCKLCQVNVPPRKSSISQHAQTTKHKKKTSAINSSSDTAADTLQQDYSGNEIEVGSDSAQHSAHILLSENSGEDLKYVQFMQKPNSRTAAIEELKELNETINNPKKTEDECEAFGQHIVVQLKKLHPEQCILAQEELQRVLTKYRLASLSYSSSDPTPAPDF